MKISVICVYNNKKQYDEQLKKSLTTQSVNYELIGVANYDNSFTSAAKALNYGAKNSIGDILIFAHQDIYFKTNNELQILAEYIDRCSIGDIVGTQGVIDRSTLYYTNLTSGNCLITKLVNKFPLSLVEVSCVDEGLFGMTRKTFEVHNFNENLCDNWHLYAVEFCLWARKNNHHVYVCPIQIHHFSRGRISRSYMKGLIKLADYYKHSFKYVWTTCYKVKTSWLYLRGLYFIWCTNRIIRGKPLD